MIEMPQRSVTRFFIPMIDVLLLLFCIYLVMPVAKSPDDGETEAERAARDQKIRELKDEAAGRSRGSDLPAQLRLELEELRKLKTEALQQRLSVRVLEVSDKDGTLFYRDRGEVPLQSKDDVRRLISRDREAIGPHRELFYLVLAPRKQPSLFPTREQWERYQTWFSGVAVAFDSPSSGPGRKR